MRRAHVSSIHTGQQFVPERVLRVALLAGMKELVPWSPDSKVLCVRTANDGFSVEVHLEHTGPPTLLREFTAHPNGATVDGEYVGTAVVGELPWHLYAEVFDD